MIAEFDKRFLLSGLCMGCMACVIGGVGCVANREPQTQSLTARTDAPWRTDIPKHAAETRREPVLSWWRAMHDPVFADLTEAALRANLDLELARARITEAQARRGVINADRLPQVDFEAQYSRAGSGSDALAFAAPPGGAETNLFAVGVVAGWEVDLWGRVQRLVGAADLDSAAAIERYRDAAVSLLGELALAYIDVRTLEQRLVLVDQNVTLQERTLELAESRYRAGNGPEVDVTQARRLLQRTRARVPELQRAKAVAENLVAVLLGERPTDGLIPDGDLPDLAPPDLGLPAELITRRADVRQASWDYRAALARTEAADLERLPRLTLSGSFQMSADDAGGLFDQSFVYSFGPQISFPLFDGHRIDANVRVRESQAEQARVALEQTLLLAIQEVENAAVGYLRKREQSAELSDAVAAARRTAQLADQLYVAGLRDLTQSIDAQRELVAVEDELAVTQQQVLAESVRLYRALGGGWQSVHLDGSVAAALSNEQAMQDTSPTSSSHASNATTTKEEQS